MSTYLSDDDLAADLMVTRMAPSKRSDTELDRLIVDITVDCYGDDEERSSFLVAIDECLGRARIPARIAGFDTKLFGVDDGGDRRGLMAKIRHDGQKYNVALHDIELAEEADPELAELLAAYRRWCAR